MKKAIEIIIILTILAVIAVCVTAMSGNTAVDEPKIFEQECSCGLYLSGPYEGDEYYFECSGCGRVFAHLWQGEEHYLNEMGVYSVEPNDPNEALSNFTCICGQDIYLAGFNLRESQKDPNHRINCAGCERTWKITDKLEVVEDPNKTLTYTADEEGDIEITICNICPPYDSNYPNELMICPGHPEPNEPEYSLGNPNAFIEWVEVTISPSVVIASGEWAIELEATDEGLCLTGDLDKLDEAAKQFFGKYLKGMCDEYLDHYTKIIEKRCSQEPNEPEECWHTLRVSEPNDIICIECGNIYRQGMLVDRELEPIARTTDCKHQGISTCLVNGCKGYGCTTCISCGKTLTGPSTWEFTEGE